MFFVTSSRVAPQENLLLLSQQMFVWDRSFLLALTRFARCKSLVGQPSEFPKSLIWQEFTTFGSGRSISREQICKTTAPVLRKIERSTQK